MLPDTDIEATRKKGPGSPNSMMSVVDVIHRQNRFCTSKERTVQYNQLEIHDTCVMDHLRE